MILCLFLWPVASIAEDCYLDNHILAMDETYGAKDLTEPRSRVCKFAMITFCTGLLPSSRLMSNLGLGSALVCFVFSFVLVLTER